MLKKRKPETSISKRTKSIAIRNTTVWMLHKGGGENTSNLSTIPLWLETFKRDCNVWKSTSTSNLLFSMSWYSGIVWKCHCMLQCGGGIVEVLWRYCGGIVELLCASPGGGVGEKSRSWRAISPDSTMQHWLPLFCICICSNIGSHCFVFVFVFVFVLYLYLYSYL